MSLPPTPPPTRIHYVMKAVILIPVNVLNEGSGLRYCGRGEASEAALRDLCVEKETPSGERMSNLSYAVLEQARGLCQIAFASHPSQSYSMPLLATVLQGVVKEEARRSPPQWGLTSDSSLLRVSLLIHNLLLGFWACLTYGTNQ